MARLDAKIPEGPIAEKWTNHKNNINLVSPSGVYALGFGNQDDASFGFPKDSWVLRKR